MEQTASVLMKRVVYLPAATTVSEAARVMKKSNIGSVLIGDSGKPAGIFTERDIARRVVAAGLDPRKTSVGSVMTRKIVTVESREPLEKVFDCLARGEFRHLPITDGGRVVGIVSLTDLSRVLSELARDQSFLQSFVQTTGTPPGQAPGA